MHSQLNTDLVNNVRLKESRLVSPVAIAVDSDASDPYLLFLTELLGTTARLPPTRSGMRTPAMSASSKLAAYIDKLLHDFLQTTPFAAPPRLPQRCVQMDFTMYGIVRHYNVDSAVLMRHELEKYEDSHNYIVSYINCAAVEVYAMSNYSPITTAGDDDDNELFSRLNMLLFLLITHKVLRSSCVSSFLSRGRNECSGLMLSNSFYDYYAPIDIEHSPVTASSSGVDESSRVLAIYNRINKKIKRIRVQETSRLRLIHKIAKELKLFNELVASSGTATDKAPASEGLGAVSLENLLLCSSGGSEELRRELCSYDNLIAAVTERTSAECAYMKNYSKFFSNNSGLLGAAASSKSRAASVGRAMDLEFLQLLLSLEDKVCSYVRDNSLSGKYVKETYALLPRGAVVARSAVVERGALRWLYDSKVGASAWAGDAPSQLAALRAQHQGVLDRAATIAGKYSPYRFVVKK